MNNNNKYDTTSRNASLLSALFK